MRPATPPAGISAISRSRQTHNSASDHALRMAARRKIGRSAAPTRFLLLSRNANAGRAASFAIPLLAGSPARRNPVQALDRNRDSGDRAADRHGAAEPVDPRLSFLRRPRRYVS